MTLSNSSESIRMVVLEAVLAERERQDKIWGIQDHDDSWWNIITVERNGDIAREVYGQNETKLFIELIQTCATYLAWAETVRRRYKNG
jgi:hypothetical protein|tara:strand:- start:54 stop:317 length:264 start_codon:yes stop_codon:yes gene_type:complete